MTARRIDRILFVALVVAGLLGAVVPDAGAASGRPEIVSPVAGAVVGGKVTVEALSSAKYVYFQIEPGALRNKLVEVVDGQASATFSTLGKDGHTDIAASNCSTRQDCGGTSSTFVIVDNPAPIITTPADGSSHFPTSDLDVAVDLPAGAVALDVEGFREQLRDTAPPFVFHLDGAALVAGPQEIVATACDSTGRVCHGKTDTVTMSVLRPGLKLSGGAKLAISPNGDGIHDKTHTQFRLEEPSDVTLQLVQDGSLLRAVDLGELGHGWHEISIPDDLGSDPLTHGRYTVRIVARLGSEPSIVERAELSLTVDTFAPEILAMEPTKRTFYPFDDGYRDWSRLSLQLDEAASVYLEIEAEDGTIVLSEGAYGSSWEHRHIYGYIWEGLKSRHAMYPEGVYTVHWTMTDLLGNARTVDQRIRLEQDELVEKSVRIRVEASEAVKWDVGRCSDVRRDRRWRNGRALLSDVSCDSSPYDNRKHIVAGFYRATLPKSVTKQEVALKVYGGAVQGRSKLGSAVWINDREKWSDVRWAQGTTAWHPFFYALEGLTEDALRGRTLTWIHFVNTGMKYRIRDIQLRTTRTFLVDPSAPAVATVKGRQSN